ncbi:NAD dependent epimerase/dehydratase [Colletotrichum higginsianum IMI 349063]|uniref:NAD dependent epimerase/dehydratase n=1 Tax=Colletotrichum higginsianum (strain IMI 349063) TaxID=759273 RepID=A0A1B7YR35_COLHI|nr:NAD dependent epimerase/dehydratase [Colletotrichum higginsianum IMI 349063]OBR14497.1 NAD dependent epimerase/dehydratase [Colletotrichum higginsianum IMI 349063]
MSQSLIFITGATGFIGAHVVAQTLEAGHHVRLSVRKESQISSLKQLFAGHEAKLDFAVIPDLTKPGAFDQALQGAEYVFHLASPMPGKGSDFKTDYLGPAVEGTNALLDAAKAVPSIKRVVVMASGANQSIPVDPDMEFPSDPRANAGLKYQASKILAHRAVLEWVPKNQPGFSVVTLHPSFVFGRNLHQKSHDQIDGTNAMLWESLFSEKPNVPMATVDVRDVALAHLKALDLEIKEKATVQEFLLSAPKAAGWDWERVANFVREKYPALDIKLKGPFDEPPKVEAKRATELLGIQWRSMEDTISSFLDQQVELKSQL